MFEHLTPQRKFLHRKRGFDFKAYLALVSTCLVAFLFFLNSQKGPAVVAQKQPLGASLLVNSQPQSVVVGAGKINVLDFDVLTRQSAVALQKIKINLHGLYQPEVYADLKLFQGQLQIGSAPEVDADGAIYFELEDYYLQPGHNIFSLLLDNSPYLRAGDILQFSFANPASIVLSYDGQLFFPQANYPQLGPTVSLASQGQINVINNSVSPQIVLDKGEQVVAQFSLNSESEAMDLKSINLVWRAVDKKNNNDLTFTLWRDDQLIAQAKSVDDKLEFLFKSGIVIAQAPASKFILKANDISLGDYQLSLEKISATGYASGVSIDFDQSLFLADLISRPLALQLNPLQNPQTINNGVQTIFASRITAIGGPIYLEKISWQVSTQNLEASEGQLWLDNNLAFKNIKQEGNYWVAELKQPIVIDHSVTLSLKAKLKLKASPASIMVTMLGDSQKESKIEDNFLWQGSEQKYNGFAIPGLPQHSDILTD